jgi:TRAP-type mannitol/chloroaromatic compound transport system permease large subunit
MLERGYDRRYATGVIAATGTLGQLIPPSIALVLLGDVLANAYQQSQLAQGNFAPETISVGDLFAGALLPGLVLVGLYGLYTCWIAMFRGSRVPAASQPTKPPLSTL